MASVFVLNIAVKPCAFADEHGWIFTRRLCEEAFAGLGVVGGELRPAAAAAAVDVGDGTRVEVALDPLLDAAGLGARGGDNRKGVGSGWTSTEASIGVGVGE
jgi:hypothetical protein